MNLKTVTVYKGRINVRAIWSDLIGWRKLVVPAVLISWCELVVPANLICWFELVGPADLIGLYGFVVPFRP